MKERNHEKKEQKNGCREKRQKQKRRKMVGKKRMNKDKTIKKYEDKHQKGRWRTNKREKARVWVSEREREKKKEREKESKEKEKLWATEVNYGRRPQRMIEIKLWRKKKEMKQKNWLN